MEHLTPAGNASPATMPGKSGSSVTDGNRRYTRISTLSTTLPLTLIVFAVVRLHPH
jgi:hypothetical protein